MDFETAGAPNAAAHRAVRTGSGRRPAEPPARQEPPHSILDDDLPDLTTGLDPEAVRAARQADDSAPPRSLEDFQSAARRLYDSDDPDDVTDPTKNRSLARIEKTERRQQRTMVAMFVAFLLLVAVGGAALYWYFSSSLGAKPAARGYGTAQFDESAQAYLVNAAAKREGVAGYLAFPGFEGQLVYTDGATSEDAASAVPQLSGGNWLSGGAGNTVLVMNSTLLDGLTDLETMRDNAGFTLYLADGTYRCKTMAVYYSDPDEAGGSYFVPAGGALAAYDDYLDFVLGARMRSLYDTDITVTDGSRFLTLVSAPDADGISLCVTGRVIEDNEDAQLATATITQREDPLLPAARCQDGSQRPDTASLLAAQLEWYATASAAQPAAAPGSEAEEAQGEETSSGDLSQDIAELQDQTDALMDDVDALLAGLTDKAGEAGAAESDLNQGAEGTLPEQDVPLDQVVATPAPTPTPDTSADGGTDSGSSAPPSDNGGSTGETINVTMNGSQQTLDLVTCLAMIAQNELGSNAPAEAYKAQCVAAHCWILSQGGYPSVAGATPGAAALAAAQEVAHVLITYNGNVCFTPYFASASTGTASAADVWGNDRAWLQAVESPYDQSTATHWNTNGATSGTARFSRATLQQRILDVLGIDLSGVDPNSWFKILSANQYGWVSQMQIGPDGGPNTTCRGSWFRETLLAGQSVDGRSLRSQCFTVTYDAGSDCFIFDVYGYGHGVGMSQWGAVGYANNGWTYQQILQHYYPGTTLTTY